MEHDNALRLMDEIFKKWRQSRDIKVLKVYFIEELSQWFTQHIAGMDTVTAMFFKTGLSPCSMR
jgi:hemerythrin